MSIFLTRILMVVSFLSIAVSANAAIITFEDVTPDNGAVNVASGGFNFQSGFAGWTYTPPGGLIETSFGGNPHSSMRLAGSGDSGGGSKVDLPGPGVRMTKLGGGVFDVFSFDASTFAISQLTDTLTVVGNLFGGGFISTTFDITTTFQSFSLISFVDLSSIDFYSTVNGGFPNDGFQIDNIATVQQNVPEPGTFVLMGLGLAGFGFSRKRKAA